MSSAIALITQHRYIVEAANKMAIYMTIENRVGFLAAKLCGRQYKKDYVQRADHWYIGCFDSLPYEPMPEVMLEQPPEKQMNGGKRTNGLRWMDEPEGILS